MPLDIEERIKALEDADKDAKHSPHLKWIKDLGIIGLLLTLAAGVVIYFASKTALDRVQQQLASVTGQLAVAEDHIKMLQAKVEKTDALADRLSKADAEQIAKTLDQVQRPEMQDVLNAGHIQHDINILAREVADLYMFSQTTQEEEKHIDRHLPVNVVRDGLYRVTIATMYNFAKELPAQQQTGKVCSTWLSQSENQVEENYSMLRGMASSAQGVENTRLDITPKQPK